MKTGITPNFEQMMDVAINEAQKGLSEGGIPIGLLFSIRMGLWWEKGETGESRTTILPHMEKQMLSETPAGSDPILTSLWLQRWRHAGTAAD